MNHEKYHHFFVVTGGPGAGKSTLLNELTHRGYSYIPEGARRIIQEQVRSGGDAVPWGNIARFKELMLAYDCAMYEQALKSSDEIIFFDRSVLDLVVYDRLTGTQSSPLLCQALKKMHYNKIVFLLPPWQEIYCNDVERKQTWHEAIDAYNEVVNVYQEYGYDLIEVPKMNVAERADFAIEFIKKLK